jgi:hypothetical protein
VTPSESFIGFGNFPSLTQRHKVDLDIGIDRAFEPFCPSNSDSLTKKPAGSTALIL